jgi:hypothetical protein
MKSLRTSIELFSYAMSAANNAGIGKSNISQINGVYSCRTSYFVATYTSAVENRREAAWCKHLASVEGDSLR